ncbi:sensor domain-containing diguanylate cyclase [Deinococcus irradiatisoli]|nr:sensor domain-containing diguanylate cyclase [Deinococcus irradiatisoli]
MYPAPLPTTEYARLMALARYGILDSPPEESFERLTALVAEVLDMPVVLINFVDQFRQWGKSCVGMASSEAPREISLCAWTILGREVMVIEQASQDERFAGNPMVVGEPHIHLYAGAPLLTPDGHAIGTLCVVDHRPHPFGEREVRLLETFAALVMEALELRVRQLELSRQVQASAAQIEDLRRSAGHAQTLSAITDLFDRDFDPVMATQSSAELLSQAVEVDWAGLLVRQGETLRLVSAWDHSPQMQQALPLGTDLDHHRHGLSGLSARKQQAIFVDDYAGHPNALAHFVKAGVKAAAMLPLGRYGECEYVLVAVRLRAQPWLGSDRALCEAAARSVRGSLEREMHLRAVEVAADNDGLTGLGNRRAFDRALAAAQADGPYAALMIDMDGLKAVNDQQGHDRGDALLRSFAQALSRHYAPARAYRLGGDEFAVLWPALTAWDDLDPLAPVRAALSELRAADFPAADASAGVAYSSERPGDAPGLVQLADARMYQQKRRRMAGFSGR